MVNFKDVNMRKLFIFQNSRELQNYIQHSAYIKQSLNDEDHYLIFMDIYPDGYKLQGHPIQTYRIDKFKKTSGVILCLGSRGMEEKMEFAYDDKAAVVSLLSSYAEICIVTKSDSVDNYFVSLYNYLLSLVEKGNDCLPITVCDIDPASFDNRQMLESYLGYFTRVRQYRNKEYMNLISIQYFQELYGMDLSFDYILMINVVDNCMRLLSNCPSYYLHNSLFNSLLPVDDAFNIVEHFFKEQYICGYNHEKDSCVKTLPAYEIMKTELLLKRIDYSDIYKMYEDSSYFGHEEFKKEINQYFKKLAKDKNKEFSCN